MAIADINNDGKKEIFLGGSKGFSAKLFDLKSGKPLNKNSVFEKNKFSEDSESIFFDADNDGDQDLFVASGGIEFSPNSTDFSDRLYINNGKGVFSVSDGNLDFKKNN